MGNPLVAGLDERSGANRVRIVRLSPYYLAAREATVAELRAIGPGARDVRSWTGHLDGSSPEDLCPYTASPGPHDGFPVSCVDWGAAQRLCKSRGADLPTEAQLEYAMGATRSLLHVWGQDEPRCGDAVWGLASPALALLGLNGAGTCRPPHDRTPEEAFGYAFPAPKDAASAAQLSRGRDALVLSGGTLWDLAGNLAEWTLDRFQYQDEPCWSGSGVLVDPVCDAVGSAGPLRSVRGGMWVEPTAVTLRAASRRSAAETNGGPVTGVRCARAAR
jgi:formylglycine-generating enzyme required for sulfatase activity